MKRIPAVVTLVLAAFALGGCGGSGEVSTSTSVSKQDVATGIDLSWADCAPLTSSEPDHRPGGDFFADAAPRDGDLVPVDPVTAAICVPYTGMHPTGGTEVELRGSSLDGLVNALNAAPRYDGDLDCTARAGTSRRVVFRYDDGRVLPVLLSTDTCGWADNGAQLRYALMPYLDNLDRKLQRAIGQGA